MPRPNARVPPVAPKPKDPVPRKKNLETSPQKVPSRVKKLESEESDDDDFDCDDDDDDENSRNSVRRAAVTISRYTQAINMFGTENMILSGINNLGGLIGT